VKKIGRGAASIAESFWRAERLDRTDAQTIMDERLIQKMDIEYNDDEIGSLEDEDEATRCRAHNGDDSQLQAALQEFLREHKKNGHRLVCTFDLIQGQIYRVIRVRSDVSLDLRPSSCGTVADCTHCAIQRLSSTNDYCVGLNGEEA
jgi:hypothetical protein